nr:stealth family protein [Arthrobacter sp. SF27]
MQGVEIHFWDQGESILESLVWNDRIVATTNSDADRQPDQEICSAQSPATQDVSFPIDVVFTWVDGTDPEWLKRKASALQIHDPDLFTDSAIDAARFADHDELRYSLRSIEQFAPWVRKIWIVTAGQTPPWLNTTNPRIQVVDHEDIWPSPKGLPTFNSHAIEANLHRIPDLAEYYLYFNDDVLLGRPIAPELFFHANGITKFFQSRALVDFGPTVPGENASTTAAKNARQLIQQAFGVTFSRKFYHVPAPISRKIMTQAEERFRNAFQRTREASFRTATDIAPSGSMYLNYAYAAGHAVPGSIRYDYIDPATDDGRRRMENVIRRRHLDVICVNDGATEQSLEEREETDSYIRHALGRMFPVKSSFEL